MATDFLTTCSDVIFRVIMLDLILKVASAQVVETSVPNNNPSQDSSHLDHHSQSRLCENAAISLYSLHIQKQFVNRKCCGTMIDNFILVHFISALQMPVLSCVPFLLQDYSIYENKPTIRCPCRCKVRALQRRP